MLLKSRKVKEVPVPIPVVFPTPLTQSSAFNRWWLGHVSHFPGELFAVVAVNTLARSMTRLELREAIRHLEGIDAEMEKESRYVASLSRSPMR